MSEEEAMETACDDKVQGWIGGASCRPFAPLHCLARIRTPGYAGTQWLRGHFCGGESELLLFASVQV